ncbi:hypothetical protein M2132_000391 [Dysgonomonas sp. PH5-45]|uniref:hypothetical protein n=1 Tax=unclassified Dysgonomonas TaxID=2630389 RepID=UPI002474A180|nr:MULTISPECIES: hypothetical protein [unclassified Dysgonomonas]MDH6354069.1 hypothetical protein [Dysgonomonas sp. PH5-45]MDH6387080.1 hypothetical protein [Dysgonomonas sp. PH5-37]
MKFKLFICLFIGILFCSCVFGYLIKPIGFKYKYDGKYTGIDTLINIEGYYYDGGSHYIMFYSDGLASSYSHRMDTITHRSPVWGNYVLSKDTIKFQKVVDNGLMTDIGVDMVYFIILSPKEIKEIYPAYKGEREYSFHPLENRIDSTNWLLKKKWFWKDKNAYKKRKKE